MGEYTIDDFLKESLETPIIDVRTPAEHRAGHIPGAINIPLFEDQERALVGTDYKQRGKSRALLLGLEIVGPKMRSLIEQAEPLAGPGGKLLVHCWRGGMRSQSVAWLYNLYGLESHTLQGGYKSFRRYVMESFSKRFTLLVLGGYTGSRKTEILHRLKEHNEQILDLEGLANHRGSVFGDLQLGPAPTQEHFENKLAMEIRRLDPDRVVWIEDESRHLGRIVQPGQLFDSLRQAPVLFLESGKQTRAEYLAELYGQASAGELIALIRKVEKRLGGLRTKEAIQAIEAGDARLTAGILLDYYDRSYEYGLGEREGAVEKRILMDGKAEDRLVEELIEAKNQLFREGAVNE